MQKRVKSSSGKNQPSPFFHSIVMATFQVKDMDDRLYQALAARAARENRSVSQTVVSILQQYLASPVKDYQSTGEEILTLAGSWQDDRTAVEIVRDLRMSRRLGHRRFPTT
jgi:plasmid stability protein